jgi:hypothetical protein
MPMLMPVSKLAGTFLGKTLDHTGTSSNGASYISQGETPGLGSKPKILLEGARFSIWNVQRIASEMKEVNSFKPIRKFRELRFPMVFRISIKKTPLSFLNFLNSKW